MRRTSFSNPPTMRRNCAVLCVFVFCIGSSNANPSIVLSNGAILRGTNRITEHRTEYAAYLGIPYAKPPIDELRFRAPISHDIVGDIDATRYGAVCPQFKDDSDVVIGSEDCLFLNVYVPPLSKSKPLPVMVFIHGGGLQIGSGNAPLYGPDKFMDTKRVILVTFNYRLGPLGFLTLEDESAPGNMGFRDQIMVLRWVQNHIKSFGGNPELVTIFGNSAGGTSVMHHLVAPGSAGLFRNAISQSGPLSHFAFLEFSETPSYYGSIYAHEMGCELESSASLMAECLRRVSVTRLIQKSKMFETFPYLPTPWKFVPDAEFSSDPAFPIAPEKALKNGSFHKVPMILGGNDGDGTVLSYDFLMKPELFDQVRENFDTVGTTLLLGMEEAQVTDDDSATANIIRINYMNNKEFSRRNVGIINRMLSDVHFLGPIDTDVKSITRNSDQPVYYYSYRYRASIPRNYDSNDEQDSLGAWHFDECFFLFNISSLIKDRDVKMSEKMVEYWVNFAMNGRPTNDDHWTSNTDPSKPEYAILDDSILSDVIKTTRESEFDKNMDFLSSSRDVMNSYRNFNFESHPAIQNILNANFEDADHDEL